MATFGTISRNNSSRLAASSLRMHDELGAWSVEPVELHRVFPLPRQAVAAANTVLTVSGAHFIIEYETSHGDADPAMRGPVRNLIMLHWTLTGGLRDAVWERSLRHFGSNVSTPSSRESAENILPRLRGCASRSAKPNWKSYAERADQIANDAEKVCADLTEFVTEKSCARVLTSCSALSCSLP